MIANYYRSTEEVGEKGRTSLRIALFSRKKKEGGMLWAVGWSGWRKRELAAGSGGEPERHCSPADSLETAGSLNTDAPCTSHIGNNMLGQWDTPDHSNASTHRSAVRPITELCNAVFAFFLLSYENIQSTIHRLSCRKTQNAGSSVLSDKKFKRYFCTAL